MAVTVSKGTQFLADNYAAAMVEVAVQIDVGVAKDKRIADLEAEVKALKDKYEPEPPKE